MAIVSHTRKQMCQVSPAEGRVRLTVFRAKSQWSGPQSARVYLDDDDIEDLIAQLRNSQAEAKRKLLRRYRLHDEANQVVEMVG